MPTYRIKLKYYLRMRRKMVHIRVEWVLLLLAGVRRVG